LTRLDTPEAIRAYVAQVARHRSWVLNPDEALTAPVVTGMAAQALRLGRPYCPCRDVDGLPEEADLICPCAWAQADIDQYGQCYCGLYLGAGKDPKTVASIPERRP